MTDLKAVAAKWQKKWEDAGIFNVKEGGKKFYVLEMYPYPSGAGLHMGHARNYSIGDAVARFKRMQGYNVLYPMGYDSFGLPAENAAIKAKSHPKIFTEKAIENFVQQQKDLGFSYDWNRMIACHKPDFYKWDQWIFLKMLEKGLVYRKKSIVNWCPKCNTVLANEQVHSGKCWRHEDTNVKIKDLEQWFFRITDYAEELLQGIDKLTGWSEDVKTMQRNWIGKSKGTLMDFQVEDSDKNLSVFTTRPDTFYGITFLVYAPEHPDVMEFVKGTKYEKPVKKFVEKIVLEDRFARTAEDKEKEGMFIGKYAINPITKEKIPIYIANFVLYEYGTGAIIAVPAHDQRDFEFAKKYDIPIRVVINPPDYKLNEKKMSRAYVGDGVMVNSEKFNGMNSRDAMGSITKNLEKNKCGKATIQYKLRDWLISRQRFWGAPIPMVHCSKCGIVPVAEKDLPVKLPDDFKFTQGTGNPLENCKEFVNTNCPKCKGKARRETDTMDTFVDSSWYFLRYLDPKNNKLPFDKKKASYWLPIDMYIGGKEHATMHLIYFRFFTKFLRDLGLLKIDEPTLNLFNQGMLHKGGYVMSKSRGNVVTQEEIEKKYGIDTARFFLLFVAGPDKDMEWDDKAVDGTYRLLRKISMLLEKKVVDKPIKNQVSKAHKAIRDVTLHMESLRMNLALISIQELANYLHLQDELCREAFESLLLLMAPFTPHLAEELWEQIGNKPFISTAKWPSYDARKIDLVAEASEELLSDLRNDIRGVLELTKITPKKITLIACSQWKHDFIKELRKAMKDSRDSGIVLKKIMSGPLKRYGKDISKLVPSLLKNPGNIPAAVLGEKKELEMLKRDLSALEKEFKCSVELIKADNSKDAKTSKAMPGKPGIVVA
ncbi:leucine--tRNA ligase [Nanoarchaeota archaeon]